MENDDTDYFEPGDLILSADWARGCPSSPLDIAIWIQNRIRHEAIAGRHFMHIPAYLALPEVLKGLAENGYKVTQERVDGPWRISWE